MHSMQCLVLEGTMLFWLVAATSSQALTISVTGADDLQHALQTAPPGTVIELAPGQYGAPEIKPAPQRPIGSAPIILRSADTAHQAEFSGLAVKGANGLIFESIHFRYHFTLPRDAELNAMGLNWPFQIAKADQITIRDSLFEGDLATEGRPSDIGYPTGTGLVIRFSSRVRIENNEVKTLHRGFSIDNSSDVVIAGNDIHSIRMDGMNLAAMDGVRIEGNHIHDFTRSPNSDDHADMIQFWTAGTHTPNRNVTIRGNILNSGVGLFTQSIFMRNEMVDQKKAGQEMYYSEVLIEDNVIINAHLHGITLGEANGVTIRNNTLIHNHKSDGAADNSQLWVPRINLSLASDKVLVVGNITAGIAGAEKRPDWVLRDNLIVQDASRLLPGFYDTVFADATRGDPSSLAPFTYREGGPADGERIGAAALRPDRIATTVQSLTSAIGGRSGTSAKAAGLTALMLVTPDAIFVNRFGFDARPSRIPENARVTYRWTLDGLSMTGPVLTYTFQTPGQYRVELAVMIDGERAESHTASIIEVPYPDLLRFDAKSGGLLLRQGEAMQVIVKAPRTGDGTALSVGQGQPVFELKPAAVSGLFGARSFNLELRLRAVGSTEPAGEILRVHQTLQLVMTPTGGLDFRLFPADGNSLPYILRTRPLSLHDGGWHDIAIGYNGAKITLTVDGTLIGTKPAQGPLAPRRSWGLAFGNPFGEKSFDGEISSLNLRVNGVAYAR